MLLWAPWGGDLINMAPRRARSLTLHGLSINHVRRFKIGTVDGGSRQAVLSRAPSEIPDAPPVQRRARQPEDAAPAPSQEALGDKMGVSPVVVGCTMIDMHVSTRIDENFKVSWPLTSVPG